MMKTKIALFSIACAAAAAAWACGGAAQSSGPREGNGPSAKPRAAANHGIPTAPLALTVSAVTTRGDAHVMKTTAGTWAPLAAGQSAEQVSQLRTLGRGAAFSLATPAGNAMLWLRGNSRARLSQDRRGAAYIELLEGDARVDFADSGLQAFAAAGDAIMAARGEDVLLSVPRAGAGRVALTSRMSRQAEWSLDIDAEPEASGFGRLEAGPGGNDDSGRAALELRRVHVAVKTEGDLAVTSVEHIFFNASDRVLEGTFRFPVPDGAMLHGLAMEIAGKLMEGEIVDKEKARRTYESIVDSMQDPALLEWEQGNWFKLRVFPIEPSSEKRVIIRYAAPLLRGVDGWEYVYTAAAPDMQQNVGEIALTFNGKSVARFDDLGSGKDIVVRVPNAAVPQVVSETRQGATYTAVRLRPDWSRLPKARPVAGPRSVYIIVDTSRSSLEGRELALEILSNALGTLGERGRFQVVASDITVRAASEDFVRPTAQAIGHAVDFIKAIEPDGASDVGIALADAGNSAATEVLYIGDGTPTWGVTDPGALKALAARALAGKKLDAAVVGKGADTELWTQLTAVQGGIAARPRTALMAKKLAFFLSHAHSLPRLRNVAVSGPASASLFPSAPQALPATLIEGDEMAIVLRTEAGQPLETLTMTADFGGQSVEQKISLAGAKQARFVAQRWAVKHMAQLEADGADKETIVGVSKDFGILSRHTSLLVLESEEAYRQHQIERRRGEEELAHDQGDPTVTGGDLESLSSQRARLSPDHIQPGDPEIRIPAPSDARSVVVVFPFGDTKLATFDAEVNAWIVRFLIDKDTPDGKYAVQVTITHADGRIEKLELPYFVDTRAPDMKIVARPLRGGGYLIVARQKNFRRDLVWKDSHRVEVQLPGGETVFLDQKRWGKFSRVWQPSEPLTGSVTLKVVVTDRALNQKTYDLVISPPNVIDR